MLGVAFPSPDKGGETNYAPAEAINRYADNSNLPDPSFTEWIKTKCTRLEEERRLEWMELALVWELVNKFIEGKQMLRRRHRGFGWDVVPMPESTAAMIREQNKIGFYSRSLNAKWVSSRTKISSVPGDDTDASEGATRASQRFYDSLEPMVYTQQFRQQEGISAQIHGAYARYWYYDADDDDSGYTNVPVYGTQTIGSAEGIGECLQCGYVGSESEFEGQNQNSPSAIPVQPSEPGQQQSDSSGDSSPFPASEGLPANELSPDDYAQAEELMQGEQEGAPQQQPSPDILPTCPQCGSQNVITQPGQQAEINVQVGTQQKKLGRIKCEPVPYSELRHDFGANLQESAWMRWRRRVRKDIVRAKYGELKFPIADSLKYRDWGLEYEERMRRSTVVNYPGTSSDLDRSLEDFCDYTQWWFTPPMYADYIFPEDVQTIAGETIPKGTKASDLFPDGMYVAMVEGIDAPLQVRNECHRRHWLSAPYHMRLFTGVGLGVQDAVEMQRQWNVVLSLVFTHIRTCALPGWLYDKDAIEPDSVRKLGQAQITTPVSLRNRPEGTRIEQLVYQMPPGSIPSHIPWYLQQLDGNMQTAMGNLVNEGLPGVGGDTATGAQIFNAAANQHLAPQFALKAQMDIDSAYIMLDLAKEHYVEPRYLPIQGKNGMLDAIYLSSADLCNGQVRFEAVPDSWIPNTQLDRQDKLQKLVMMFGGVPGLQQALAAMPDFVAEVERAFGVSIASDSYSPTAIMERERIEQIKRMAPQYQQIYQQMQMMGQMGMPMQDPLSGAPADPATILGMEMVQQLKPTVALEEPNHQFAVKWLRDLLVTDEMKQADDLTRAGVKALIRLHIQLAGQEQMVMSQLAMMGQTAQIQQGQQEAQQQQQGAQPGSPKKTEQDHRNDSARANMRARPEQRKDHMQRMTQVHEGRK